ncbi:TPA: hypothetical protein ACH3X1_000854 [Trebouxia sp. C0004]
MKCSQARQVDADVANIVGLEHSVDLCRTAVKVVAKNLSGLWKFVVHLKLAERCGNWAPPDIVTLKRFQTFLKRSRLARRTSLKTLAAEATS